MMIFQPVRLTEPQHQWLKKEAVRLGLPSVAELMRRIIDDQRGAKKKREKERNTNGT